MEAAASNPLAKVAPFLLSSPKGLMVLKSSLKYVVRERDASYHLAIRGKTTWVV